MAPRNGSDARDPRTHALHRHEQRRQAGTPAVSVLAGPVSEGIRLWQRWNASPGRAVVQAAGGSLSDVVARWTCLLALRRDLVRDAVHFLAERLHTPADALHARLARQTLHERTLFLDQHLTATRSGADVVCRWLLEQAARQPPLDPEALAGPLDAALRDREPPGLRLLVALHDLVPAGMAPALLLAREGSDGAWLSTAARLATQVASAVPPLPVAVAVAAETWTAFLRDEPESHARALLRETVVEVTAPPTTRPAETEEPADRARSAAERFLHARLESLPDLAGLFTLNLKAGFPFGPREAEIDLGARQLGLAIEIDGHHHFQDLEAYRRDRRKDLELQKHGYLVLRFHAEDVVARLEEILETIRTTVAYRRERLSAGT